MKSVVVRLLLDDKGQDLIEYALLTGIAAAVGVLTFSVIADGMASAYTLWESDTQDVWEPCEPAPAPCP